MNRSEKLNRYDDPLYAGFNKPLKKIKTPGAVKEDAARRSSLSALQVAGLVLLAGALAVLAYFLFQAQDRIDQLNSTLAESQTHLNTVSQNLETSQGQIQDLQQGIDQSQTQLQSQGQELNRYRGLYSGLKEEQQQQSRELEAVTLQKADQSEVRALKDETGQIRNQVDQANIQIDGLKQTTVQQSETLEQTRSTLSTVQQTVATNSEEIAGVKRSLEREYYNFELQEGGGYMKVFNIALNLKDTDFAKRQFDLYILADGKAITRKDQPINSPIYFYIEGQKKPYEVVITRVDRKFVVGYLSIPKT